jgi:hypothetical protein
MGPASDAFYSDRTYGPRPRDKEVVSDDVWTGLAALIWQKIDLNWLAHEFPVNCSDVGRGVIGTDRQGLFSVATAMIPGLTLPLGQLPAPDTATALDLVDFVAQRVAKSGRDQWHEHLEHYELSFEEEAGRNEFRADINQFFARTGMAYELGSDNRVGRLGPVEIRPVLANLLPDTGDETLDSLIVEAVQRYVSRDQRDARIGIEKLWDAFERLKTIEAGSDKRVQVSTLLRKVASGPMRDYLNAEAIALTDIGNNLQIRHHETSKHPVEPEHIDYLFGRMAILVLHLLRCTGRLAN